MRIEAYTQIQQIYGTKNKARTQNTAKVRILIGFRSPASARIFRLRKTQLPPLMTSEAS